MLCGQILLGLVPARGPDLLLWQHVLVRGLHRPEPRGLRDDRLPAHRHVRHGRRVRGLVVRLRRRELGVHERLRGRQM